MKDSPQRGPDSPSPEADQYPEDLSEVMDFSSYNLRTTIRLIVLSGECRRIEVKRGTRQGAIFVREGEIYRTVTNALEGDEAFFEILAWDRTVHRDCKEPEPPGKNMRIPTKVLLEILKSEAYAR